MREEDSEVTEDESVVAVAAAAPAAAPVEYAESVVEAEEEVEVGSLPELVLDEPPTTADRWKTFRQRAMRYNAARNYKGGKLKGGALYLPETEDPGVERKEVALSKIDSKYRNKNPGERERYANNNLDAFNKRLADLEKDFYERHGETVREVFEER